MFRNYLKIVLLVSFSSGSWGQSTDLQPQVDQRVELLSILARLADYPEYSQTQYKAYVAAIETHFTPYKDQPAVAYMRQLRNSHSIGFDAVMSYALQLGKPPVLQPLVPFDKHLPDSRWTVKDADSLTVLIRKFYRDAHCAEFFQQQAGRYEAAEKQFTNVVRQIDLPWFRRYYGQPPTQQFHVVIGLANGGGNYGVHLPRASKAEDVYAVMGTWATDSAGMATYPPDNYLPVVIHEFNHSFVNPLIDQNGAEIEPSANVIFTHVKQPMERQAYATGKTMLYEALVRASVVVYLQQHDPSGLAARNQLREEQHRRFVWVDTLVGLLRRYENNRGRFPTLQAFMPEHSAFYQHLAVRIDTVLRAYDARCPNVASLLPFANQATDVDPATQEVIVKFDKPLNPKKVGIQLGPDGKEHMPIRNVVGFADSNRALRLKVALKPNWTYSFRLRSGGFQTPDGHLSDEYMISFKTKP